MFTNYTAIIAALDSAFIFANVTTFMSTVCATNYSALFEANDSTVDATLLTAINSTLYETV